MLSDRFIKNAKPGLYADGDGLYLKVYPSGKRSFVRRTQMGGKNRVETLGPYPKLSLAAARELCGSITAGRVRFTVREAFDQYYVWLCTQYREPEQVKRMFDADVLPNRGDTLLDTMARTDWMDVVQGVLARGKPVMANRVFTAIKKFLDYCEARGWCHNPLLRVTRSLVGGRETAADRNLSFDEIRDFITTLTSTAHSTSLGTRYALAFCLVTGCRPSESLWCLHKRTVRIPASETKTRAHTIPRTPLIRWLLRTTPTELPRDHRVLSHALRRLGQTFTPHKFRHTLASRLADLGVLPHITEKLLNHKMEGVMAVYNHAEYWPERIAAQRLWDRKLLELRAKKDPSV